MLQEIEIPNIVIPNFVPALSFNSGTLQECESHYGIGKDGCRFEYSHYYLFVGMLEIHKGILDLLKVFMKIRNKINAKLVIVGDGSLRNYIERFIEKNSLEKIIIYKGFVDDAQLFGLYTDAKAVIMPSIWPENAPLVALEALSVGTPVIVSNTGGLPEIVEKFDKKLIFRDYSELENLLLGCYIEKLSRQKIIETYQKNFSPEAYIKTYFDAIKKRSNYF
jgi:glycosyltransferase involved in cell wall biosynthesis